MGDRGWRVRVTLTDRGDMRFPIIAEIRSIRARREAGDRSDGIEKVCLECGESDAWPQTARRRREV